MNDIAKIKGVIKSTKTTQQITGAMYLMAVSKLNNAQSNMAEGRPYADKLAETMRHVANSHSEFRHPFLEDRKYVKSGYIIVSTDRGLCGSLNNNLFKQVLREIKRDSIQACLIGKKASGFFHKLDVDVVAEASSLGDRPELNTIIGITQNMIKSYNEGHISHVSIAYNRFINTMVQKPIILQLLPIPKIKFEDDVTDCDSAKHWDYLYEPDAAEVMNILLERYIESQVYQAVLENIACEQAARMIAMKNATDNAQKIIDDMKLVYNKARQASITQELSEIVSGAEAIN